MLKTSRPQNNSRSFLLFLEELLPETTSEMSELFRAETALFPPSVLNFGCSQTRLTKTAGI